ncbi:MAG: VirB4 family type IV secretion system protein [Lachnospiraceae bacterium]
MKKKEMELLQNEPNHALLNVVTPVGLEFGKNTLSVGENYGKAYGVIRYPQKVEVEWLSRITNIPSTIVSIGFSPVDNGALISAISRNVSQQRGLAEGAKDPLARQRAEKAAEDGETIMKQIDREGETVGLMSVSVMPIAKDERVFRKVCRRAESMVSVQKCKMRAVPNLQKECFKHISPAFPNNEKIESILQRIVPLSTFVGGFPFASSGFNDGEGYYFAQDTNGGLVIVDTWRRASDRTNSNFVIMGNSGVGKSTAIKHIIQAEYMKGTKIIVIDPESEYKGLCYNLKGDWINAVGGEGGGGRFNPLQVRPSPRDDEQENESQRLYRDEGYGMNDLALHMKNLEIFFSLYIPSITDMQRAVLKQCLVALYQKFGIGWNTDVSILRPEDFPVFSDLLEVVREKETQEQERNRQPFSDLALLLQDIAEGSDSFIWNGHTTIAAESQFICLDTHALQETGDNIKRTQYFNLLTYCWEQMSRNREERVLLICDEAYLMIDQKVPQSLVYLRNVMKRARKYEAALAIISHSIVDFLSESIKQYGQALLDVPCYKVLMGTDGKNLKETADLYDLTEAEQELLLARKRGHALFMAGAKRLHISFEIPEYKMAYMGKAGGR